jgi:transposase-like protein
MAKEYRKWTPEQKLQAILPILRGEVSLSEQSRRLRIGETQLYKWRDIANHALLEAFNGSTASSKERELTDQVADLERLCGKQAVEIEVLKKTRLL